MVAGDLTVHREVELQEGYRSPVVSQSQFDMVNYSGDLITLKVRDLDGVSTAGTSSFLFTYPQSITLEEFVNDAATRFDVPINQFELVYQDLQQGEIYELSSLPQQERLSIMNITPSKQKEYAVTLERKRVKKVKNVVRRLDAELDAVSSYLDNSPQPMTIDPPVIFSPPRVGSSRDSFINIGREFVGLKNMTMTCYLNSLIQSLFFTPELRNALYMYQYVDDIKKKKSIAFALQKLFLQLQFSVRDSIGTEELTNTFGWKGEEVWIQHDIEELYRLLMEHLSEEFKSTPLQSIISSLYGGILNDYVECLECKNKNCKEELFLALPLPVRVFGSPLNAPTLEEALRSFIVPEILDAKNQYNCERCQKPCDAKKGLSFKKLPYILTIALKRFEFNWERLTRHKVNDKVMFPIILDMNDMVDADPSDNKVESELVPPVKPELIKPQHEEGKRESHSRPCVNLNNFPQNNPDSTTDEGIDLSTSPANDREHNNHAPSTLDEMLAKGPNVYQLYAILIHRGGVSGGHYFAFIRDFETNQWYRCDDTTVRRISEHDIQGTFGGADTYLDGLGKDHGVAYMLVYRRYDPQANALPMSYDMMPLHMKTMWDNMRELDENVHNQEELDRNTIRMSVYLRIPGSIDDLDQREMTLLKANTMQEAAIGCYNEFFKGESVVQPHQLRLVRYDRDLNIIENSFDGKDDEIVCIALKNPAPVTKFEGLLLEMRESTETFVTYRQDDNVFRAHLVSTENEDFSRVLEIHVSPNQTAGALRRILANTFKCIEKEIVMVVHKMDNERHPVVLIGDERNDMPISSFCFPRVSNLYLECFKPGEDPSCFIRFITNYVLSYSFEIKIQVMPSCEAAQVVDMHTDCNDGVFAMETPVMTPEVIIAPISPSAFQYSDGEILEDVDGMQEFEPAVVTRDFSDPSTSEDSSLTGSDRTLVVDGDGESKTSTGSHNSPTKSENRNLSSPLVSPECSSKPVDVPMCEIREDFSGDGDCNDSSNVSSLKHKHYFRIIADKKSEDGEWRIVTVRVDRNIPLNVLSSLIKDISGIEEKRFIMYKVYNGCEYEVLTYSSRLHTLDPIDELKCVIGHRLQTGEGRVDVYLLQMDNIPLSPVYLKDFVLSETMTANNVKALIAQEINGMNLNIDLTYCRLRKKSKNGGPSRIIQNHQLVRDVMDKINGSELFLQVLDSPDNLGDHHCVLVRRWHPSEWILDQPQEILIPHDYARPAHELVLEKLCEVLEIKRENLQVARPENHGSFPYQLNPLVIQERLDWFSIQARISSQRQLYLYSDELFLFVRDKTETIKALSAVERQEFEKGLDSTSHDVYDFTVSPRREMGLIINLARTPPT